MKTVHLIIMFIHISVTCVLSSGQWSEWRRHYVGQCLSDCQRYVFLERKCLSNRSDPCLGLDRNVVIEICKTGLCIKEVSKWSPWSRHIVGQCQADCQRYVLSRRLCVHRSSDRCKGFSKHVVIENCSDGLCLRASGQWSEWRQMYSGQCEDSCERTVFVERVCTTATTTPCFGLDKDIVREQCSGDLCPEGVWTTWSRHTVAPCSSNCQRSVSLRRQCRSTGGSSCRGRHHDVITERCAGENCSLSSSLDSVDSNITFFSTAGILAVISVTSAAFYYRRYRRKKETVVTQGTEVSYSNNNSYEEMINEDGTQKMSDDAAKEKLIRKLELYENTPASADELLNPA